MDRILQQEEYLFNKTENTQYFFVTLKTDYSFSYSTLRSWIRITGIRGPTVYMYTQLPET